MTTMELNLRKEYLYDLIKGMDEERLSKVETYIKTSMPCQAKGESLSLGTRRG